MRLRLLLALVLAVTMTTPAWAAVSEDDVAEAAARLAEAQARADELTRQYEAGLAESYRLEQLLARLALSVQELDVELGETRELVADRAVEIYMRAAAGSQLGSLVVVGSLDDAGAGLGYLNVVAGEDLALVRGLEAREADLDRQRTELDQVRVDHDASVTELEVTADLLLLELEAAQTEYRDLVAQREAELAEARRRAEEEARRQAEAEAAARAATSTTTVAPTEESSPPADDSTTTTTTAASPPTAPPASAQTCPVDGPHSFTDTWGAPRSGGRSHQGVDMLAARWTPLVAIESGSLSRLSNSSLGGISIWLQGSSGDTFYYAHLEAWADGIYEGLSVAAGDLLGYVGTTGNAPAHIPHLHFEYHPGGGGAVNPTPLVTSLCR